MNDKYGGARGARRAGALAVLAAVAVLATACGGGDPSAGGSASPSAGSPSYAQLVALSQCIRSHGVPTFPDPDASGGFHLTTTPGGSSGAIDIDSSQIQTAYRACRHVLPGGGPDISQLQQEIQQKQQRALPAMLKLAQCMRSHGVPDFPDPTANGLGLKNSGIDPESPQFQAALAHCQHVLPAGLHISVRSSESVRTPGS